MSTSTKQEPLTFEGRECALTDNDFDGRVVDVPVRAGDVA